jgi:predicted nucleic acid-binding Zn ribbon protein
MIMTNEDNELCLHCKTPIPPHRARYHAKYCSDRCSREAEREKYQRKSKYHKKPRKNPKFTCAICGKVSQGRTGQKYCSKECRMKVATQPLWPFLSTGTVGAINELKVACDLFTKGYEVFRALSPSCSCDLIALKNGVASKIEVRTATKYKTTINASNYNFRGDYLVKVLKNRIIYEPELEIS